MVLAQLLDLVRAGGDCQQGIEREAGVVAEGFRVGIVETGKACRRQPVPLRLPLRSRRFQLIAQRHQFIELLLNYRRYQGNRNVFYATESEGDVGRT